MKPASLTASLTAESFAQYPAEARELAVRYLELWRAMPLALLPAYLAQVLQVGELFPVEAERLRLQLAALAAVPARMEGFRGIVVPPALEAMDWVGRPGAFEGALAESLWQTGQIDAYHRAGSALFAALPSPPGPRAPLLIGVMGRGASALNRPALFTRMRAQGLYLRKVREQGAAEVLRGVLEERAKQDAAAYAHWYVDGGEPLWARVPGVEGFTFPGIAAAREAAVREMDRAVAAGVGPERLAEQLRALPASAFGTGLTGNARVGRFVVSLLTEGSGTQLYSTSFVQAAAVALVKRAEPRTLVIRFAPRRRSASLNDMLEARGEGGSLDAEGALVDADMAVWYAWLALRRLSADARMVVWVEGRGEAFVAGPGVARGGESFLPTGMLQIVHMF